MEWRERLQLIAATATVTSFGWILVGSYVMLRQGGTSTAAVAPQALAADTPAIGVLQQDRTRQAVVANQGTTPAAAMPVIPGGLVIPVQGVRQNQLVDTFTQSREGGMRRHDAIDIMAPIGTPVLAAAAGQLEKLFVSLRGGNTIYVRSNDQQLTYYYAHLDHYAPGLAEGQQITSGQVLGAVGYTGDANAAGPHLHFAINAMAPGEPWYKGTAINPFPLLMRK